ncbi:MAG: HEPN/Toprim-associated domain-containing protein [Candidatus Thiodiazotropha lotti]|nr:HEPN/Toprim-associated domain-containing protein [Candidatus Thiodiazotropha lotti]MCW4182249.1 HEPN/Toprim-associated domain-containing protein [Candidatus Thiodiazotropha weberae]
MGTYTELEIAGYPLWSTKSAVDPVVMTVFREADKRIVTRKLSERNPLVWGQFEDDEDAVETAVFYVCRVAHVRDRLDVMGFTMDRVRREFEVIRNEDMEQYASWAEEGSDDWSAGDMSFMASLTFDSYASAFRDILKKGLRPLPFDDGMQSDLDEVTKYILSQNDDYWLGFLGDDIRSLVRLACESVDENADVLQDITDLVEGGYYSVDESVCNKAIESLTLSHPENASRIILTEGSTDSEFLKGALHLLYPHLAEYYSFLDFEGTRSRGGAGHLASLVKAFAGAGISDRVIALFDNDTAASEAIRALEGLDLPSNIAVLKYPDLDFLRSYPTLGPEGGADLDINGSAASLELYLGSDVLLRDGLLSPVQWKGYSEAIGRYQGEVMHKGDLQEAYRRKLDRGINGDFKRNGIDVDWSGMKAIWQHVFNAFR